ncbi:DUF1592 domain-containing protein [Pseudobacteriovorax antillogorgiicola]|uniref:DUF1592 domain-containing protein n=1 Tax=Pseudobacteriovorax antillogorgiicola TaxID=1513793 RepID=A0A1Y6BFT8_9BACT|nr:DUF1592 domain-containing protein [Pseudobacteriovorax antillogorgiicola]TCS57381.1 uncharacterized protein DUF1585 [Pseudobacteriovorax antillogorgiicola]SMF01816.1 Protein of unknown function [Pseudobacteriovorax antillogorgiicola]
MVRKSLILSLPILLSQVACTQLGFELNRKENKPTQTEEQQFPPATVSEETIAEMDQKLIDRVNIDPKCEEQASSSPSIRTLTREEYLTTVTSRLSIDLAEVDIASELPLNSIEKGFRNIAELNQISRGRLEQYLDASELVAEQFILQSPNVFNCGQAPGNCVDQWLKSELTVIWRQAIAAEDYEELIAFFEENGSNEAAFKLLVQRVIMSPNFLTIRELGSGGQLSSYELLSSLAFSMWGQGPDKELIQEAANTAFDTREKVEAKVRQMMKDDRFDIGLKRFLEAWLETDRIHRTNNSEETFPGFTNNLKGKLEEDVFLVFRYLIDNDMDTFENIVKVDFTFTSSEVAQIYGLNRHESGVQFRNSDMYALQDSAKGLMSLPGIVSGLSTNNNSNIPMRGNFVLSKVLCTELPEPSAEILEQSAGLLPDMNLSARDSLQKQTEIPACYGCHESINGIGFGLENLSPIGKVRSMDDHQKPVNAISNYVQTNRETIEFNGAQGMNDLLSISERAQQCMATQIFRFSYGRFESTEDKCTIAKSRILAWDQGTKFSDILVNLYTSPLFMQRK